MPLKIKSVSYDGEKVKIAHVANDDKNVLESRELPSAEFKASFFDLKKIADKVSGLAVAVNKIDIAYLPGDDEQYKSFTIGALMGAKTPFTGVITVKMPEVLAGELDDSDLIIIDAVILNAKEYLKGNRAQMTLIFGGDSE